MGSCCSSFSFLCSLFLTIVCLLVPFLLDIALYVIRFTSSDCPLWCLQPVLKMKPYVVHFDSQCSFNNPFKKMENSKRAKYLKAQNSKLPQMLHIHWIGLTDISEVHSCQWCFWCCWYHLWSAEHSVLYSVIVQCWCNLSILSVPDEYYSRNALCALNLISTFLFDNMINYRQNKI